MTRALLSTTYFGPVQWYQKLFRHNQVTIEACDHFVKQTYRNRCVIATANGTQALTVPIEHADGAALMRDIRLSDHGNWRHLHWNALVSAYGESPFFEYYADDIRPFFEKRWTFLWDYNMEITRKICELLDIESQITCSDHYEKADEVADVDDFREVIRPKKPLPDSDFTPREYYQVYGQRTGFLPNMSVLDLLFNMGNESVFYL